MKINIKDIVNKGFINNSIENGEITKIINFFDVYQLVGLSKFFIEYDKALKNNKNITQIKNNLHDLFTIKSQFDYADKRTFQLIFLNDYITLKEINGIKISKDEAISELLNNEKDIENLNQIINVVKDSNFNYLKFVKILYELKKINSDISDIVKIIITNDKGHVSNKNKSIFSSILKKLSSINIEENESVYLFNIKNNFKSLLSSTNETIINNNSISYYLLINSLIEELINIEFYKLSNKMVTETRLDYINYSNKENVNLSIIKDDFNYETKNKIKDIIVNEAAFKLVNDILKNGEIKNMDDSLEITNTFRENMEKEYINKIINIEVFYNNSNLKELIKYLKTILQQTHIKVKLLFSVMATIEFVLTENKYSMLKFEELVNINMFKYDSNRVDNDVYAQFVNKDEEENINDMSTQIDEENINIDNIIDTLSLNSDNENVSHETINKVDENIEEKVNLVLDENIFDEENVFNENNISELQNNQNQDNQVNNFDINDDFVVTFPIDKGDDEEQQSMETYIQEDEEDDDFPINQNTNISFDDNDETSNINFDSLINNENNETNIKIDFNNEDLINVNHNHNNLIIQDDDDNEIDISLDDIDNNLSENNSVIKSIHEFVINPNTSFIDDLEPENFGIFESYQEEALELITTIKNTNFYTDDAVIQNQNFKRFFHSLKGNSSMVGLTSIAEIFYWLEMYFEKNINTKINNNQLNIIEDLFTDFKEFLYEIHKDKTSIAPIAKYYKLVKNEFDDNIGFSEFNGETYSQYLIPVDNDLSNTSINNEISNEENYEIKDNNEDEESYNNENELDSDDDIFSEDDFDDDELEVNNNNNNINTNKISFKPQEVEEKEDFNEKFINVNNESDKFVDEQIEEAYEVNQNVNADNNNYYQQNNNYHDNDNNVNNYNNQNNYSKKVISINGETVYINGKVFNAANYFQFLNELNRSIEQLNHYNETNYNNINNNNEEILINMDVLDFFNNITYNLKTFNLNKTAILYNNLTSLIRIYIESNIYFNHSLYSILNVSINNLNNVVNKNMEEEFEFEIDNIKLEIQTIMNVKTNELNRVSMENLNNKITELVNERFVSIYGEIEKLNEKLATINEYQNNIKLNVKDISNNLNKANLEINLEQLSSNIDTLKNDTEKGMKMLNKNIKTIYNIVKSLLNNKDDGNNSGGFFGGLFKK